MPGRKIILVFWLIGLVSSASREQQPPRPKPAGGGSHAAQAAPPPPKPADDGPSLEATMKFIQDKMNAIGPLRWTVNEHDIPDNSDRVLVQNGELYQVVADPRRCTIGYHVNYTGKDVNVVLNLKEVEKIKVVPLEQRINDLTGAEFSSTIRPPIFDVMVNQRHQGDGIFDGYAFFHVDDEELANRLARAITHAVELCTPEKQHEPF
jgi:hypothetical protein